MLHSNLPGFSNAALWFLLTWLTFLTFDSVFLITIDFVANLDDLFMPILEVFVTKARNSLRRCVLRNPRK